MSRTAWAVLTVGTVVVVMRSKRGRPARKVYVEEVSSGARPIEAVGTSIAAFVGLAPPEAAATEHLLSSRMAEVDARS